MGIFSKIFQRGQEPGRDTEESESERDPERDQLPTEPIVNEPDNKDPEALEREAAKDRSARLLSPTPRIAGGVQVVPQVPKKPKDDRHPTQPGHSSPPSPIPPVVVKGPRPATTVSDNDQTLLLTPTHPRPTASASIAQGNPPRSKTKTAPGTLAKADARPSQAIPKEPSAPIKVPVGTPTPINHERPSEPVRVTERPVVEARPVQLPRRPARPTADVLAEALRELAEGDTRVEDGTSTASDLAAARRLFDELAVDHVTQVRDVMLELSLGDVPLTWVESTKPALRSQRAMAQQMEQTELCGALDEFCTAVDHTVATGQAQVTDQRKAELQTKYAKLIELIPKAFELDAERDRREPVIVEILLRQVDGVEDLTIHKLFAVGLGRLVPLLQANASDLAAASGIPLEVATAIVARLRGYRDSATSTMTAPDSAAEHRELRTLVTAMKQQHDDFERASAGWSERDRTSKRSLRKFREQTWLRVKLALARLGERDRLARLDKLPFGDRIGDLDRYLAEVASARRTSGQLPTTQG